MNSANRTHQKSGSDQNDEPVFFQIGKMQKPHGIKGEIKLFLSINFPLDLAVGSYIYIGPQHDRYKIASKRGHGNPLIISLDNIETRESVRLLSNKKIFIQEGHLPKLKEGDFFYSEIVGMDVRDEKGVKLGRIREILPTGSNDVYIMESIIEGQETLIPAIVSVILSIDKEENLMIVCLPEWY